MSEERSVRLAAFGDLHLGFDPASWDLALAAVSDCHELRPDALVFLGDVVDMCEKYWPLFARLLAQAPDVPRVVSRGNADFDAGGDAAWDAHVGLPLRQTLDVGPTRLVVLSGTSGAHELDMGEGAGAWVAERAAERRDAIAVVVSHAPVRNTTFWSCDNAEDGCLRDLLGPGNPPYHLYPPRSDELRIALRDAPNVRLFLSGHVHNDHRMRCDHGLGSIAHVDGVTHAVTANLGGWADIGVPRREYRVIDVGATEIVLRVRDCLSHRWVPELEVRLPGARRP